MEIRQKVLRHWNISGNYSLKPIHSYWKKSCRVITDNDLCYVLKEKENSGKSVQEYKLLLCLQRQGLPVSVPLLTTDSGLPYAEDSGKVFCLYPRLPGVEAVDHYSEGSQRRGGVKSSPRFLMAMRAQASSLKRSTLRSLRC